MHPLFDLSSKVAVVTGASRGIGEGIARAYAEAGAALILASRKADKIEAVARDIRESGGTAFAVAAHCGRKEEVDLLMTTARAARRDRHSGQ
jgi:NADP-dependent 3-hydroxy acid dehydrogenase YdfG